MEPKTYDFFGITADGAPVWMYAVGGRDTALEKFRAIAEQCEQEIWVFQIAGGEVLACVSPIDGPRGASAHLDEFLAATTGAKMPEKNVGKPQLSAVDTDRPSGLAADVLKRGESALENCEEMRDANARMLNQNHEIMTAVRNGVDLRKDEGKTIVEG